MESITHKTLRFNAHAGTPHAGVHLSPEQRFGLAVEHWVLGQLNQLGHQPALVTDFFKDFDILIDGILPVEVKASRPYTTLAYRSKKTGKTYWRTRWQWNLGRGLNPEKTEHLLVAVAVDDDGQLWPYVLHSAWLLNRGRYLAITSHPHLYSGWLAPALNGWQLVDEVLNSCRRSAGQQLLPLFAERPVG